MDEGTELIHHTINALGVPVEVTSKQFTGNGSPTVYCRFGWVGWVGWL